MIYVVIGYEYHHYLQVYTSKLHISYDFFVNLLASLFHGEKVMQIHTL